MPKTNKGSYYSKMPRFLLAFFLFLTTLSNVVSLGASGDTSQQGSLRGTTHRQLPNEFRFMDQFQESLNQVFSTAPQDWTMGQWFLALLMIFGVLWCCGCLQGGRRYYYRQGPYGGYPGGYYGRTSSGGCCGCLQNILMCFCCYELCCADCQHVPCCDPNAAQYTRGAM